MEQFMYDYLSGLQEGQEITSDELSAAAEEKGYISLFRRFRKVDKCEIPEEYRTVHISKIGLLALEEFDQQKRQAAEYNAQQKLQHDKEFKLNTLLQSLAAFFSAVAVIVGIVQILIA